MAAQSNGGITNPLPEWINVNLFENVIKENVEGFAKVRKFEVNPGSAAGENYATVMLRVSVEVELNDGTAKSLSFMMKICHDNEMMRQMMKIHNLFDVEKGMYEEIVPAFEKLYSDIGIDIQFGPKSYQLPTAEPYILLENLSQRNFKNANRLEGLNTNHTEHVLRKLAQWHAASAVYATKIGQYQDKYRHSFFREEARPMMEMIQDNIMDNFRECVKNYSNYEVYAKELESRDRKEIMDMIFRANQCDPNEFNVLNHGDCWSNNVMFQYDAFGKIKETYLIDYQIPKYGTPAQDLYYFLLSSTSYDVKLTKFDYFIKFYHDNLCEHLKLLKYPKAIPRLSELHRILYKYGIMGYSAAVGVMSAVLLDPTENAVLDNFIGDGDEGQALKKAMYSNARYRKHMEAILPWLQNRGAFSF